MDVYVKYRPFVKEFLSIIAKYYEVVVFTAGMPNVVFYFLALFNFASMRIHCSTSWIKGVLLTTDCSGDTVTLIRTLELTM